MANRDPGVREVHLMLAAVLTADDDVAGAHISRPNQRIRPMILISPAVRS